jgi:hypothetical protein
VKLAMCGCKLLTAPVLYRLQRAEICERLDLGEIFLSSSTFHGFRWELMETVRILEVCSRRNNLMWMRKVQNPGFVQITSHKSFESLILRRGYFV